MNGLALRPFLGGAVLAAAAGLACQSAGASKVAPVQSLSGDWAGTITVHQVGKCAIGQNVEDAGQDTSSPIWVSLEVDANGAFVAWEPMRDTFAAGPLRWTGTIDSTLRVSGVRTSSVPCRGTVQLATPMNGQATVGAASSSMVVSGLESSCPNMGCAFSVTYRLRKEPIEVPSTAGWMTYENPDLGISIRHPAEMTIHAGDDAGYEGFIRWPPPDVRMALPLWAFEETNLSEAAVVIYASLESSCERRPGESPLHARQLAGRQFCYDENSDGAGGHSINLDSFGTRYREQCLTIAAVMQDFRYEDEGEEWVARSEKRRREIEALLRRVMDTLVLTDETRAAAR